MCSADGVRAALLCSSCHRCTDALANLACRTDAAEAAEPCSSNNTLPGDARNCTSERFCATRGTQRVQNCSVVKLRSNSGPASLRKCRVTKHTTRRLTLIAAWRFVPLECLARAHTLRSEGEVKGLTAVDGTRSTRSARTAATNTVSIADARRRSLCGTRFTTLRQTPALTAEHSLQT